MKFLVLINPGIEEISKKEISSFGAKNIETNPACLIIEAKQEDIIKIAYRAQTINRILISIGSFSFTDATDFEKQVSQFDFHITQKFAARSEHLESQLSNAEIQKIVGAVVTKKTKTKVDLSNPDIIVYTFINKNRAYLGIDITGDISKRDYRIFIQRDLLKAPIAYAAVLFSEWHPKLSLLDPFCNTGIIPIEAALAATNKSSHYFKKDKFLFHKLTEFQKIAKKVLEEEDDKLARAPSQIHAVDQTMRAIEAAKKNAKIAGVNKDIKFSRKELSWLDTKFGESSIDRIISLIPQPSKIQSEQKIGKIYHEFFYQAGYTLKKDGKICLITRYPDLLLNDAKRHGFKEQNRIEVTQGKEILFFVLFSH